MDYIDHGVSKSQTRLSDFQSLAQASLGASQMVPVIKNSASAGAQEAGVQSLGREDPLEKGITTHSSILAWRIPRTEEPGGLQSVGSQRAGHN